MKNSKINLLGYLQSLGKTFMLPVALMSAMGILLGLGSAFALLLEKSDLTFLLVINRFIEMIGSFAFSNISILFAIAIPLGLAKEEKGVAAFAGFIGYFLMNLSINFYLKETGQIITDPLLAREAGQTSIMGITTLDIGILGSILCGTLVTYLHNKFYQIRLPLGFSFFEGSRFIPIITAIVLSLFGLIIPLFFPYFSKGIAFLGESIHKSGILAPFFFGAGERILLPFGLHHILVAIIRFTEAGGVDIVDGQRIVGALNIFYAEIKDGLPPSPEFTRFLSQGKMPSFLFGLPAAALAMYMSVPKEKRTLTKGLFLSGVIAVIIGGITEPIEFLFLFVSPLLFVFHSLMTGLGFLVMALLKVAIGNTDGNILDFFIFGVLKGTETHWYFVPIVGILWFAIYFFVFKWAILKYDIKTPGRGEGYSGNSGNAKSYSAEIILSALGGKENITSLDNCLTRLRLEVKDASLIDEAKLKESGALGVVKLNQHTVQVVFGPQVQFIRNEMEKL